MRTNAIYPRLAAHTQSKARALALLLRHHPWLWAGFLAFATIALGLQSAQAAVTEAWVQRYSNGASSTTDRAIKVVRDAAGDIIVTGSTVGGLPGADILTIKYSGADGSVLWQQRYNSPGNGADRPTALAVDGSGNVVVTGMSEGDYYYTARYAAADGEFLWEKRRSYGQATAALAVDGSGNVVVTGSSFFLGGAAGCFTAKYAAADGALRWEHRYSSGHVTAVAVDASGNVVVTGQSRNGTNDDYYTAKYAAVDGALLWERRYDGLAPSDASAREVAVDGSGNVAVTGVAYTYDPDGSLSGGDYYTAKYAAADGALLWERRYNGGYANAVAVDGSGNVVVTGYSYGSGSKSDYLTVKYAAADGALLWEKRYNGPANDYDEARAVAVDGSGNVVVTGRSYDVNLTNPDYYTAKYAADDGALLWEKRYNGPADSHYQANAVALDGSGNVVVTGNSYGSFDSFNHAISDYYTAKYAAADGALLWEKRFTGPATVGDSPHCLALGPDGMVAVTGSSNGGYATVVYRDLPAISIDLISTGVRLRGTGRPGRSYTIERAPAVTGPWSTVNTQTSAASGAFEYLDTNPPAAAAFYRTNKQ